MERKVTNAVIWIVFPLTSELREALLCCDPAMNWGQQFSAGGEEFHEGLDRTPIRKTWLPLSLDAENSVFAGHVDRVPNYTYASA